jgi:hypothetical protein
MLAGSNFDKMYGYQFAKHPVNSMQMINRMLSTTPVSPNPTNVQMWDRML